MQGNQRSRGLHRDMKDSRTLKKSRLSKVKIDRLCVDSSKLLDYADITRFIHLTEKLQRHVPLFRRGPAQMRKCRAQTAHPGFERLLYFVCQRNTHKETHDATLFPGTSFHTTVSGRWICLRRMTQSMTPTSAHAVPAMRASGPRFVQINRHVRKPAAEISIGAHCVNLPLRQPSITEDRFTPMNASR